jgi:hypothetical protein
VDATLLVALANRVKREQVVDAAEGLRLVGASLAGTILTKGRGIVFDRKAGRRRQPSRAPVFAQATAEDDSQQPEHTAPTSVRRTRDVTLISDLPATSESRSRREAP